MSIFFAAAATAATLSSPDWIWVRGFSTGYPGILFSQLREIQSDSCDMALDGEGNSYVTAGYAGASVQFTASIAVSNGVSFVAKFNDRGDCLWARSTSARIVSVCVDPATNVYVAGDFAASASFEDETNDVTLSKLSDSPTLFIAKYSKEGALLWARAVASGAPPYYELRSIDPRIACDEEGRLYVAGAHFGQIQFGTNRVAQLGAYSAFIAKFTSAGDFLWATNAGDFVECVNALKLDGLGNLFVSGSFGGFGNSAPGGAVLQSTSLTNADGGAKADGFVAKYSSDGVIQWAHRIGGIGTDVVRALAVSTNGHVHAVGQFQGPAVLDDGSTLPGSGLSEIFVVEYNSAGELVKGKGIGGDGMDAGYSVDIAKDGSLFIAGSFGEYFTGSPGGSASFGDGESQVTLSVHNSAAHPPMCDAFVAKFDPTGVLSWAVGAGSPDEDAALVLKADPSGNCVVAGLFSGTAAFPNPFKAINVSSGASMGVWLAKLAFVPRLVGITPQQTGAAVTVSGPEGTSAELQASENLLSWQMIGNITFGKTNAVFTDTNAAPGFQRFYRIQSQ